MKRKNTRTSQAQTTKADRLALQRLKKIQWLLRTGEGPLPLVELVVNEPCELRIVKDTWRHQIVDYAALDWQPVIPGSVTRMSDGTFSYLFYAGTR